MDLGLTTKTIDSLSLFILRPSEKSQDLAVDQCLLEILPAVRVVSISFVGNRILFLELDDFLQPGQPSSCIL